MIKDNFTNIDKQIFDSIFRVTETIERLYEGLYNLEIKGLKNSEEYNRKLNLLKIFLKQEEQLYNDVKFDKNKVYSWLKYIKIAKNVGCLGNNFDSVIYGKYENKTIRRIYNKLYKELHIINLNIGDYLNNGFTFVSLGNENNSNLEKLIYNLAITYKDKIEEEVDKDFKKTFFTILNEYINDQNYLSVRDKLIYTKYYFSFIFSKSEEYMLRHSFSVPADTYLLSKMESSNLGDLFTESFEDVKDDFCNDLVTKYINILIDQFENMESDLAVIICKTFIRALLINMSYSRVKKLKDDFESSLNRLDSNLLQNSKYFGWNLVNECFNSINKDREKVKLISLK